MLDTKTEIPLSPPEQVGLRLAGKAVRPDAASRPLWWELYRQDIRRWGELRNRPAWRIMLANQGAWAMLQYRASSGLNRSALPIAVKIPAIFLMAIWQKLTEITTGISISPKSRIGGGMVIWHYGNIYIHQDAEIGSDCFINGALGALLGEHDKRAPKIGNNVSIGPGAIIVGGVTIGDHVVIGPRVTITGPFRIGSGATILPGADIMENVPQGATVYPSKPKLRMLPSLRANGTPAETQADSLS